MTSSPKRSPLNGKNMSIFFNCDDIMTLISLMMMMMMRGRRRRMGKRRITIFIIDINQSTNQSSSDDNDYHIISFDYLGMVLTMISNHF